MSKATEALERAVEGKTNAVWHAQRGLGLLGKKVDARLVERAMRLLAKGGSLLSSLRKLPAEYAPLAARVLSDFPDTVESTFFSAWGGSVQSAGAWRHELGMISPSPKSAARLAKLSTPRAVEAAQATLAKHGLRASRLLPVLAHEGSESSADVVLPLVASALERRGAELDALQAWLEPFARGHFVPLRERLDAANAEREGSTQLVEWLASLGVEGSAVSFEVSFHSRDDRWSLYVALDSKRLPHVTLALSTNARYISFTDFQVRHDRSALKLKPPRDLESVPAWLGRTSKKLKVKWRAEPQWVKSSLRGKARQRAVAWLMRG